MAEIQKQKQYFEERIAEKDEYISTMETLLGSERPCLFGKTQTGRAMLRSQQENLPNQKNCMRLTITSCKSNDETKRS